MSSRAGWNDTVKVMDFGVARASFEEREVVRGAMDQRPPSEGQPQVLLEDSATFTVGLTQTGDRFLPPLRPRSPAPNPAPLWFWLIYGAAFLLIVAGSILGLFSLFATTDVASTPTKARTQTSVQRMSPVKPERTLAYESEKTPVP